MVTIEDVLAQAQGLQPSNGMTVDDVEAAMISREPSVPVSPLAVAQQYQPSMAQQPQQPDQYDRVTQMLMKAQQQPQGEPMTGLDIFQNYAATVGTGKDYRSVSDAEIARRQLMQDRQVQSGKDLLAVAEQKAASGDLRFKKLIERIKLFTGDDPEGQAAALEWLDNPNNTGGVDVDPDNGAQIVSLLGKFSQQTGYKSYDLAYQKQKKQLELEQMAALSERYKAQASGVGGGGSTKDERLLQAQIEDMRARGVPEDQIIKFEDETRRAMLATSARGGRNAETTAIEKAAGEDFAILKDQYANSNGDLTAVQMALNASDKLGRWGQNRFTGSISKALSSAGQQLNVQSVEQALNRVQQTKGAISNAEMDLFMKTAANPDNNFETNQMILKMAQAALLRVQQKYLFTREFMKREGTTLGADEAFARFAEENPIFTLSPNNEVTMLKKIEDVKKDKTWAKYLNQPEPVTYSAENPVNGGKPSNPVIDASEYFK